MIKNFRRYGGASAALVREGPKFPLGFPPRRADFQASVGELAPDFLRARDDFRAKLPNFRLAYRSGCDFSLAYLPDFLARAQGRPATLGAGSERIGLFTRVLAFFPTKW